MILKWLMLMSSFDDNICFKCYIYIQKLESEAILGPFIAIDFIKHVENNLFTYKMTCLT